MEGTINIVLARKAVVLQSTHDYFIVFSTDFQHVTANIFVQGQRVKGQGHSVRVITGNIDSLRNLCDFLTYLTLSGGRGTTTWTAV